MERRTSPVETRARVRSTPHPPTVPTPGPGTERHEGRGRRGGDGGHTFFEVGRVCRRLGTPGHGCSPVVRPQMSRPSTPATGTTRTSPPAESGRRWSPEGSPGARAPLPPPAGARHTHAPDARKDALGQVRLLCVVTCEHRLLHGDGDNTLSQTRPPHGVLRTSHRVPPRVHSLGPTAPSPTSDRESPVSLFPPSPTPNPGSFNRTLIRSTSLGS